MSEAKRNEDTVEPLVWLSTAGCKATVLSVSEWVLKQRQGAVGMWGFKLAVEMELGARLLKASGVILSENVVGPDGKPNGKDHAQ